MALKPFLDREAPSFRSGFEREPPALRSSFANSLPTYTLEETEAEHVGFSTRREIVFARDLETIGYPRERAPAHAGAEHQLTREQLHSSIPGAAAGPLRYAQRAEKLPAEELHSGSSSFRPRAEQQSSFQLGCSAAIS